MSADIAHRAQILMAAWEDGFLSDRDIIAWADRQIASIDDVAELPTWLLDLSQYGPKALRDRPAHESIPRAEFDFSTRFACRVARLDLSDCREVQDFADWIAEACLAEDSARPEVKLGYRVLHLAEFATLAEAMDVLRKELPAFVPACRKVADELLDLSA